MNSVAKIIKYELHDVVRSKWIILYALFFLLLTDGLFRFGGDSAKVILSLMNVVLLIIPLMSVVFGVMYLYNAREFIEMMLSQPINRQSLFGGLFAGLALPLCLGFVAGVGIPFFIHGLENESHPAILLMLLISGIFLTVIFINLAFLISLIHEDKVKGLGVAIFNWLLFSVIYDGVILFFTYFFAEYPLEKAVIGLTLFNPIDLARILIMLKFDVAALMGYTGAVFEQFFGSLAGILISFFSLAIWAIAPFLLGLRAFRCKDF
jgi:Cu-processing system permease protein